MGGLFTLLLPYVRPIYYAAESPANSPNPKIIFWGVDNSWGAGFKFAQEFSGPPPMAQPVPRYEYFKSAFRELLRFRIFAPAVAKIAKKSPRFRGLKMRNDSFRMNFFPDMFFFLIL